MSKQTPPKGYAKTKFALSKRLAISRTTLDKFLAMPGAPEPDESFGFDCAAVADFIAANATNQRTLTSISPALRELKEYELTLKCAALRFRIEKERGAYLLRSDVESVLVSTAMRMRAEIEQKLEREYPSVVSGLGIPEIRKYSQTLIDSLFEKWRDIAKEWHSTRDANEAAPLPPSPSDL